MGIHKIYSASIQFIELSNSGIYLQMDTLIVLGHFTEISG